METHTYPHLPREVATVHVALFCDVADPGALRTRLVDAAGSAGSEAAREAVNYAFVDARLVTSRLQIRTAVYQAILAHVQGTLRTRSVHSEVLWALNPGHNISEAIKRFGVSETSTALVVIRVCGEDFSADEFARGSGAAVGGLLTPLSRLGEFTDWELVRKYYKLTGDAAVQEADGARKMALMDEIVVSSIAMKSVAA